MKAREWDNALEPYYEKCNAVPNLSEKDDQDENWRTEISRSSKPNQGKSRSDGVDVGNNSGFRSVGNMAGWLVHIWVPARRRLLCPGCDDTRAFEYLMIVYDDQWLNHATLVKQYWFVSHCPALVEVFTWPEWSEWSTNTIGKWSATA